MRIKSTESHVHVFEVVKRKQKESGLKEKKKRETKNKKQKTKNKKQKGEA